MRRCIVACVLGLGLASCGPSQLTRDANLREAASVNLQLVIEYMKTGKMTVAQDKMEKALRQDPDNPTIQATAGLLYERLKDLPTAKRHFEAAARVGRRDPNIQNTYAGFLCRTGKTAEGERLFVETARNGLYQTPEVALTNAGVCARSANRNEAAEKYFRDALGLRPNFSEALLQLANLSFVQGKDMTAKAFIQRYLGAGRETPEVLWLAVRVERHLGNDSSAAEYARKLQDQFPDSDEARALRAGAAARNPG
jgi:type IV pilus assembly protein PilF